MVTGGGQNCRWGNPSWTPCPCWGVLFGILNDFESFQVVFLCFLMFSLPNLWKDFAFSSFPYMAPILLPLVHIALMSSVYCTIVLSLERYARICLISNLIDCNYFSNGKLKVYLTLIILFPIAFYIPKFFEVSFINQPELRNATRKI